MDLSFPIQEYLPLISENEDFFLRKILPYLLLFPWFIGIIFLIIKKILEYLASLKPKPRVEAQVFHSIAESPIEEVKILRLKEIEKLALTDPRGALFALSVYIRYVEFKKVHSVYSLEYFVEKNRTHKKADIYFNIVIHSYSKNQPDPEKVLNFIKEIRNKG